MMALRFRYSTITIQVDALTDPTGQNILPPPERQQFTPNFQEYEVAKDSCRRAIQAAMGISPLPTAAQRDNEKSGIAIGPGARGPHH